MPTTRAILIPTDAEPTAVEITTERSGLPDLQRLVGGDVEAVGFPERGELGIIINDDGKPFGEKPGLPRNETATRIVAPILMPGDWIAGPAVVVGYDPYGDTVSVPDDLLTEIQAK